MILMALFMLLSGCLGKDSTDAGEPWKTANHLDPVELTIYLPNRPNIYSHYYGEQLLNEMPKKLNPRLKKINAEIRIGNVVFKTMPLRAEVEKGYEGVPAAVHG